MPQPAREYDDMELLFIDGIKHALRAEYAKFIEQAGAANPPMTIHAGPAEAAIDAWAKDIYERHCTAQGEHTEPSPQELSDWVKEHYPPAV